MRFRLVVDGDPRRVEVEQGPEGILIRVDGAEYRGKVRRVDDGIAVRLGSKWRRVRFVGRTVITQDATHEIAISEIEDETSDSALPTRSRSVRRLPIRAPMPGRVVRVAARLGLEVKRGDTLLVLEAMKMQNEIAAPQDGTVTAVRVVEGDSVIADQIVAVLEGHRPPESRAGARAGTSSS